MISRLKKFGSSIQSTLKNIPSVPYFHGLKIFFAGITAVLLWKVFNSDTEESDTPWWYWVLGLILFAIIIYGIIQVIIKLVKASTSSSTVTPTTAVSPGSTSSWKTPSWIRKMFSSAYGLLKTFITLSVLYLLTWFLFWITGYKNPIAYIVGEQTQEVTAPPGNWTKWVKVEENWRFKLFYDGKIALQVKSKKGVHRTVLCEQRGNNGVPLYIKDAETGKLLPMVIGDKITEIRVKSVETTPITVKIEHWKEEYPVNQ